MDLKRWEAFRDRNKVTLPSERENSIDSWPGIGGREYYIWSKILEARQYQIGFPIR